jgi:hypothetical protein
MRSSRLAWRSIDLDLRADTSVDNVRAGLLLFGDEIDWRYVSCGSK